MLDDLDSVLRARAERLPDLGAAVEMEPEVQERLRRPGSCPACSARSKPSALPTMTVPSGYRCAVAGSNPKYVE